VRSRLLAQSLIYSAFMGASRFDSLEKIDPAFAAARNAEAEEFFAVRRNRANREEFRRLLDRDGGKPPRPEDSLD